MTVDIIERTLTHFPNGITAWGDIVLTARTGGALGEASYDANTETWTGIDETDKLQSILDRGEILVLRPGAAYLITSRLQIRYANTGIIGNGATIVMSTAAGHFDNATYADRYGADAVGIFADGINGAFVDNCRITTSEWVDLIYLKPIYFEDVDHGKITRNEIWNFSRGVGMITFNDCDHILIDGNYIHDCYTNSSSGGSDQAQITGIEGDNDRVTGSYAPVITNNYIKRLSQPYDVIQALGALQTDGINLQGNKTTATLDFIIAKNIIESVGDGIDVFSNDGLIVDNHIRFAWNRAIKLIHGASRNSVERNKIRDCGFGGIIVSGSGNADVGNSDSNRIRFNDIRNTGIVSIWYGAKGVEIYDPADYGGAGAHAALTTHGIDLFDVTNGSTWVVSNTIVEGNLIDLGGTGKVGIRAGSYAGPSKTNIAFNNTIRNCATAELTDTYKSLIIAQPVGGLPLKGFYPTATRTLTSDTNAQAIFDVTTNGAVPVAATTRYRFRLAFDITSLSSSSGTVSFGFATSGGASFSSCQYRYVGHKQGSGVATAAYGNSATANATALFANTAATGMTVMIEGQFRINAGGSIIPQVTMSQAAAGVIGAGAFFEYWPVSEYTTTYIGDFT